MEITDRLLKTLKRDEGVRDEVYEDSLGIRHIGVGHNLEQGYIPAEISESIEAKGKLTDAEINRLLTLDLDSAYREVKSLFTGTWDGLSQVRQEVLTNMSFNLGISRLKQFRRMIRAVRGRDYAEASVEMLDSRWAGQVKGRANRLAKVMETNDPVHFEV